jgi:hypothetical protein
MNFSSISTARSAAVALVVSGIAFFGISSMAYAQGNNTSGQSGYKKEAPGDYSDKDDRIQGHTGEGYGNPTEKGRATEKKSQQGGSGRYDKETPGDYSDKNDPIQGHTGEGYGNSTQKGGATNKRSQQGGSGRYDKEAPGDYSDRKDHIEGHTGEPYPAMDSSRKGRESSEKRNTKNQ